MKKKNGIKGMKDNRGQITVEAVLILGFFILIFFGVTVPMAFQARNAAIDTTVLADAKFATGQIASAAGTVLVNGSRRTIDVYVPAYQSNTIKIGTRICTDGTYLNTTVAINRTGVAETHELSQKLYGSGWSLTSASGTAYIAENIGKRYTIVIEYKSINSTTTNTFTPSGGCSGSFIGDL